MRVEDLGTSGVFRDREDKQWALRKRGLRGGADYVEDKRRRGSC